MSITDRRTAWSTTDAIKQVILERGLAPGDPMPTEAELCDQLQVSRSSVREAVRTLASLDIVDVRHGHGTFVGGMSLAPLVNGLVFRLSMGGEEMLRSLAEVVETRVTLDLAMTEDLIARRRGTNDAQLHGLVDQMRRRTAEGHAFMDEDREFHARLASDCVNRIVGELVGAFWEIHTRALPLLGIAPPGDIMDTVEAHGAILRAVEEGNHAGYRRAVHAHYAPLRRAIDRAAALPRVQP